MRGSSAVAVRPSRRRTFFKTFFKGMGAAGFLAAGSLALGACSALPYAASVDGNTISQASFNKTLNEIQSNSTYMNNEAGAGPVYGSGTNLGMQFVDNQLQTQIVALAAKLAVAKLKVPVTALDRQLGGTQATAFYTSSAFALFPKDFQSQVNDDYADLTALETVLAHVNFSAAGLQQYYQTHSTQFATACASVIASTSQAAALAVRAAVENGLPFATAVTKYSVVASQTGAGGSIGCGTLSEFTTSFSAAVSKAVAATPNGQLTEPLYAQKLWLIFEVTSRSLAPFSKVASTVRNDVWQADFPVVSRYLATFLQGASVSVNSQYGSYHISASGITLSPPVSPSASAGPFATLGQT